MGTKATQGQTLFEVYKRLEGAKWALLFVSAVPDADANETLVKRLNDTLGNTLVVEAVVSADALEDKYLAAKVFAGLQLIGIELGLVPPGYFLFHRGSLVAYDPCMPTMEEAMWGLAGTIGVGLAVAAAGGKPKTAGKAAQSTSRLFEIPAGLRAFEFFQKAMMPIFASEMADAWKWVSEIGQAKVDDAFTQACKFFEVAPDATKAEFKKVFARKAHENHQDTNPMATDDDMRRVLEFRAIYYAHRKWEV